ASGGLSVRVDGPALAGQLHVPDADGAPVQGRFSHLHWQPVPRAAAPTAATAAPAQPGVEAPPPANAAAHASAATTTGAAPAAPAAALPAPPPVVYTFDPAAVLPLAVEVDDLRYRGAALGQASLRTRPIAAGLQLEHLQLRSDWQQADLTGEWTGRGD